MMNFKKIAIVNCDFKPLKIKKYYLIEIAITYCNFNKIKKYYSIEFTIYYCENHNILLQF